MPDEIKPLSDKQKAFVHHYVNCLDRAEAAILAGYTPNRASITGHDLYHDPRIKAAIDEGIKNAIISEDENTLLISKISRSNLSHRKYYRKEIRTETHKIKVPLQTIIDRIHNEISFETEFFDYYEHDEEEKQAHANWIKGRQREITRYELELSRNPSASRIEHSEPILVEDYVLDMGLLIADGANVRIKKISYDKYGNPVVELYNALDAQDKIARIYGSFKKDNEQQTQTINILSVDPLSQVESEDDETPES